MSGGIAGLAAGISADLQRRLLGESKTQRHKLALLVETLLDTRSANLMALAASLPRPAKRTATSVLSSVAAACSGYLITLPDGTYILFFGMPPLPAGILV